MLDETLLRHLYLEEGLSIRAIATQIRVPARKVYASLMGYRIPRRGVGGYTDKAQASRPTINEAMLRQLYLEDLLSIRAIAARLEVSTLPSTMP